MTGEHRLVYRVSGKGDTQQIEIASCRYHYK
jgi:toxin YoeB